jgi:hypothetical protein
MTRIARNIALLFAAGAAALTTAALPAAPALAVVPPQGCGLSVGLCLDNGRVLTEATPSIKPPATGAVNDDVRTWCVFEGENYTGVGYALRPHDRVSGHVQLRSAKPCDLPSDGS